MSIVSWVQTAACTFKRPSRPFSAAPSCGWCGRRSLRRRLALQRVSRGSQTVRWLSLACCTWWQLPPTCGCWVKLQGKSAQASQPWLWLGREWPEGLGVRSRACVTPRQNNFQLRHVWPGSLTFLMFIELDLLLPTSETVHCNPELCFSQQLVQLSECHVLLCS